MLIQKLGDNSVEVIPTKTVETTAKSSVQIYDYDNRTTYGDERIKTEEKNIDDQLAFWTDKKQTDAFVAQRIAQYQEFKNNMTAIKTAMAGEIGEK